jgi:WD40 repeat protein
VTHTFRPSTLSPAPLTCLALTPRRRLPDGGWALILSAGSWDKCIYTWTISYSNDGRIQGYTTSTRFSGHTDFVKAVVSLALGNTDILISGSADASIIVWNAESGEKLHVLKGHSRGVQALTLDSIHCETSDESQEPHVYIFSGDSSREIRRWRISLSSSKEVPIHKAEQNLRMGPFQPLVRHETSIYALCCDSGLDLWTASADKTGKCLNRDQAWAVDTVLKHPDFVRAIVVNEVGGWVVTGCRDEEVRIWDKGSGQLFHTYSGHFEEVTGLCIVRDQVFSVSIDGTIRQWSLKREDLNRAKEESEVGKERKIDQKPTDSTLTEEEERELAELMDESD